MKNTISMFCLIVVLALAGTAGATTISLNPPLTEILVGDTAEFRVRISGLGNGTAPSLGAFSFDFLYDPTALLFNDATFSNQLGNKNWSIRTFDATTALGTVFIDELSLLPTADLNADQAPAFRLASLFFTGQAPSFTEVSLANIALYDAAGAAIVIDRLNGVSFVAVDPVPEPATLLLLGTGLTGLAGGVLRRSGRKNPKPTVDDGTIL